jgi:uncharacterized protein YcnI
MIGRAALCAGFLTFAACTAGATAHVTISPTTLHAGSSDEIVLRCPNERPNASTVKLAVELPSGAGIGAVKVRAPAGWHVRINGRTITWDGGTIAPGHSQNFTILAGPIPPGSRDLAFRAVQTYSSGEVVRWIELPQPGEPPPPHPAPMLAVR